MVRLAAGASVKAVARDLKIHKSTVQHHRDYLLTSGAIIKVRPDRYARGPTYTQAMLAGGADTDRSPPRNPTAPWLMTDGRRVFEILAAPKGHPTTFPGFVGTTPTGRSPNPAKKRLDHRYLWTLDGRTFDLLLMESQTAIGHGLSLQLSKVKPAPFLEAIQQPGEDKEAAWDRFTSSAVQAWARLAGLAVRADAIRRSKPVSLAVPGATDADVKFRTPNADADATPEPGTVEVRTEALKHLLDTGEVRVAALEAWRSSEDTWRQRMEAELAGTRSGLEDVRAVSGKAVQVLREVRAVVMDQADALVAIAQTEAASLSPLPKRSLSPDSGVDVS